MGFPKELTALYQPIMMSIQLRHPTILPEIVAR
jgi:hypothetical protein